MCKILLVLEEGIKKVTTLLAVLVLMLFAVVPATQAGVIYYDDFDGQSGMPLNGTTPDITPGGETWQAGSTIRADGDMGSLFTAVLPFKPLLGFVYELSATFDNQGDWVAIGFLTDPGNLETRILDNGPLLWSLTRETGDSIDFDQAFVGPGTSGFVGNATTVSVEELKIRIETNSETDWLVTWYFDGSPELQQNVNPSVFNINYVAFGSNGMFSPVTGTIFSFKLVETSQFPTASNPSPADGAKDVPRDVVLSWKPGLYADKHDVYFGTDANDVNEASRDNPLDVLVGQDQEDTTYDPPDILEFNHIYYWRIDEVNEVEPNSPWKGPVWSFTTVNFIVVDDFEDYNDYTPNEVWNTWIDGFDDPANGSTAGYPAPDFFAGEHYMEDKIVHGGSWSMPLFYDNSEAGLSEVTRTLNADWTQDDVLTLTLFYYGDAGNAIEPMYVALNGNAVVTNDDPKAMLITEWTQWDIPLQEFADMGVNLANVNTLSIGFGNKATPQAGGGNGHAFFDDIRLYRSLPEEPEPEPESVDPGTDNLVAYYAFENNTQDGSGNGYNGTASGNPKYVSGPTGYGMAIELDGTGDYVSLPIGSLIGSLTNSTIAIWVNWSSVGGAWQRILDVGTGETVYMFLTGNAGGGGLRFAMTIGGNVTGAEDQTNAPNVLPGGWHHVAVTIDPDTTTHSMYLDGKLVAQNTAARFTPSDLGETTQNWLGRSQYVADPYFNGSLDELRIYNRALSDAEVLYLAAGK